MTVLPAGTPAWAGVFIAWIHPASLICAFVFPLVRALVLKWHRLPANATRMWIEGIVSGFTFPSFVALAFSFVSPVIRTHIDGHALAVAGGMGVVYTIASLVKVEREERLSMFGH